MSSSPMFAADSVGKGSLLPPSDRRSSRSAWFLLGRTHDSEQNRCIPITSSPFQVGRKPSCSLCLPCASVSSVHATLTPQESGLLVRDNNSTNGTFKNGVRVTGETEVRAGDLLQFSTQVFRVVAHSASQNDVTACEDVVDQAMALVLLDRLMEAGTVIPFYQPIVRLQDAGVVGHEVLCRSRLAAIETPAKIFAAAAQLGLEVRLSEMIRMQAAQEMLPLDDHLNLFLNTHPLEIGHPELVASVRALREIGLKRPVTLEIHEAAVLDRGMMRALRDELLTLDVFLAFDDFGAGQTRLTELCEVQPKFVKFDMVLIRGLHEAGKARQQMVATLVQMARELGIVTLAEGIECKEEAAACREMGFELAQGYFFGRPAPLRPRG